LAIDVRQQAELEQRQAGTPRDIREVHQTRCCIVGGGPAGVLLALLFARQGIPTTLLEARADFDRDFRGNTLHPAILEILDDIGLAQRLLETVPHTKVRHADQGATGSEFPALDFNRLGGRFPFMTLMAQADFLPFLVNEAGRYPAFNAVMSADVHELVEVGDVVRGVRYRGKDGWHEVQAILTIGADGRFSRLRRLSKLPPAIKTSQPMDILWFRLSKQAGDPHGIAGSYNMGRGLFLLELADHWQVGYMLPKGGYQQLRETGIEAFRAAVVSGAPWLRGRIEELQAWTQCSLLSVESDLMKRWYRAGLLLIGDAAHVMSPVGGNGINYAVQDAATAANLLSGPLKARRMRLRDLAAVQRRREWPTRITQSIVNLIQDRVLGPNLEGNFRQEAIPPVVVSLAKAPVVQRLLLTWLAYGIWPVHLSPAVRAAPSVHRTT
jgi:2-polyprenyl-6-methoxyphenol hydroxylase-like FAD-dependent oxidoreductase